jgi:hypothetical protein
MNYNFIVLLIFSNFLYSNQQKKGNFTSEAHRTTSPKYSTNLDGDIMIYINVLGEVNNPGRHLVSEGIDFATLLSQIGGPKNGANMSKVKVFRNSSEKTSEVFIINLKKFIKYGDRSDFMIIKPNDTIIFPETISGFIFSRINNFNTILSLFSIYVTINSSFSG